MMGVLVVWIQAGMIAGFVFIIGVKCIIWSMKNMIDINSASLIIMLSSLSACIILGVICAIDDFKICKRLIKDNNHHD